MKRHRIPRQRESAFQSQVLDAARLGGWTLRYHTFDSRRSTAGFPDLVLIHPRRGLALFRELKRDGEQPSPVQLAWLAAMADAGLDAGVWRPRDWDRIEVELGLRRAA